MSNYIYQQEEQVHQILSKYRMKKAGSLIRKKEPDKYSNEDRSVEYVVEDRFKNRGLSKIEKPFPCVFLIVSDSFTKDYYVGTTIGLEHYLVRLTHGRHSESDSNFGKIRGEVFSHRSATIYSLDVGSIQQAREISSQIKRNFSPKLNKRY